MFAQIDWNAVGAIATIGAAVLGVLGGLAKWIVSEIRANRTAIGEVNRRVVTPDSVPGTIGQTVAQLAVESDAHITEDDRRFGLVWDELGKNEPPA